MRVLIAGSSGFIGSALAASYRADGHDVVEAGRRPGPGGVRIDVEERTMDLDALGGDLNGFDAVFGLLGAPLTPRRWGVSRREALRASRIVSTDLLARAIARAERARPVFVLGAATGYYGERGDTVLDENAGSGTGFLAELCRAWEAAAEPARQVGARVAVARTGVVLGRGGGALKTQLPLFRLGLGGRLGNGRQWLSWISLQDEVRALRHLAEHDDCSGAFNLTSPNPVRNEQFTFALSTVVGRRAPFRVPRPVLEAAVGRRTAEEFLLVSQRVVPARLEASGFSFRDGELVTALDAAVGPAD